MIPLSLVLFVVLLLPSTLCRHLWSGTNSFFLHTLQDNDRTAVLDAMQKANLKVLRIFISTVGSNAKNTGNGGVDDIEQKEVGQYDDTILGLVDTLLYEVYQRGIKVIVSMHDRYSLGCWSSDAYVRKYNIPTTDCNSNPGGNDATVFYNNPNAQRDFDNRLLHILNHQNPKFSNRPWKELNESIFSFEAENEAMGHISLSNKNWQCARAQTIKSQIKNGILVTTGGGTAFEDSWIQEYFDCSAIDVISGHNYNSNPNYITSAVTNARALAWNTGKRIIVEEFGCSGDKTNCFNSQMNAIYNLGVPWLFWEILKPGDDGQFETWTNEESWSNAVLPQAQKAGASHQGWDWPEIWGEGDKDGLTITII